MSNYIVGLTGGIGSGKTTVANLFAEKNIAIVDADVVAREVVEPGSQALNKIKNHFGDDYILADGTLNRTLLRTKVFNHPEDKAWLNALLHPLIRESMLSQLKACKSEYCLLVAPLLIENNLNSLVDNVLVVDVTEATQLKRTIKRDPSSEQEIKRIMASQISRADRVSVADDIINNENDDQTLLLKQVNNLHQKYLQRAQKKVKR
ncbi:dephospho-CoA kinase [Colwelliaceae bacterium 6471]